MRKIVDWLFENCNGNIYVVYQIAVIINRPLSTRQADSTREGTLIINSIDPSCWVNSLSIYYSIYYIAYNGMYDWPDATSNHRQLTYHHLGWAQTAGRARTPRNPTNISKWTATIKLYLDYILSWKIHDNNIRRIAKRPDPSHWPNQPQVMLLKQ